MSKTPINSESKLPQARFCFALPSGHARLCAATRARNRPASKSLLNSVQIRNRKHRRSQFCVHSRAPSRTVSPPDFPLFTIHSALEEWDKITFFSEADASTSTAYDLKNGTLVPFHTRHFTAIRSLLRLCAPYRTFARCRAPWRTCELFQLPLCGGPTRSQGWRCGGQCHRRIVVCALTRGLARCCAPLQFAHELAPCLYSDSLPAGPTRK